MPIPKDISCGKTNFIIKVCPINKLFSLNLSMKRSALIICSSYELMHKGDMDRFKNRLVLQFDDTYDTCKNTCFNHEMAHQVKEFIEIILEKEIREIYFCCDAGQSRSVGLAAAYARYFGQNEWYYWKNPNFHPNTLVYGIMCKVLGLKVTKLGLKIREYINEKALEKEIEFHRKNS